MTSWLKYNVSPLPFIALAVSLFLTLNIWGQQITVNLDWKSFYDEIPKFGEDCSYAISPWTERDTFSSLYNARTNLSFLKLKMPYRGQPGFDPTTVKNGEVMIVDCIVDTSSLRKSGWAWMQLGSVFGDGAIFVDGRLRQLVHDNNISEFPLLQTDRKKNLSITILSKKVSTYKFVGLASLLPLIYTDQRSDIDTIDYIFSSWYSGIPLLRMGFSFALLLGFGIIWLLGSRSPDVGWIIVITTILSLENFLNYTPIGSWESWKYPVTAICRFALSIGFGGFLLAFFRIRVANHIVDLVFLLAVGLYSTLIYTLPENLLQVLQIRIAVPEIMTIMIFLTGGMHGIKVIKKSKSRRKRQYIILAALCFSGVLAFTFEVFYSLTKAIDLAPYINYSFTAALSMFLSADLVIFQGQYYKEKIRAEKEIAQREQLEQKLELGRSVQQMLLPKERRGSFVNTPYEFFFKSAEHMAGDWLYAWHSGSELRLIIGDVIGKGPSAALGVASIMSFLSENKRSNVSMLDSIKYINRQLLDLYDGKISTTLSAMCLKENSRVELFNCGGVGWFRTSESGVEYLPLRSGTLGSSETEDIATVEFTKSDTEIFFCFTDGVLEGSRQIKALTREIKDADFSKIDFRFLQEKLLKKSEAVYWSDDTTILFVGGPSQELLTSQK